MRVRTFVVFAVLFMGLGAVGQELTSGSAASAASTASEVPRLVQFSGIARDLDGKPMTGTIGITFLLYHDDQGNAPLWMETQNVQADAKGHYSVQLGATKPEGLPIEEFNSGEARWLAVQISGQAEQPRVLLMAVPYALKAADAATIGGLPPSAFVRANPEGGDASGGNESSNSGKPSSGTSALDASSKNAAIPLSNKTVVTPGGKTDFLPLWTSSNILGNSALFQSSSGRIGLNTTAPGATLDVSAPNQIGLFVDGPASGVGAGLQLHTTGTGGNGWEILATGKTSAQGTGKLNIRNLNDGKDIFTISSLDDTVGIGTTNPGGAALTAVSNNSNLALLGKNTFSNGGSGVEGTTASDIDFQAGVIGFASSTSGITYGVNGVNDSTDFLAAGVEGDSFATTGKTLGTVGTAASPTGTGVWGFSVAPSQTGNGLIGCCAVGVWGDTSSSGGGAAGVVGTADDGQAIGAFNNGTTHLTANIQNFENSMHNVAVLFAAGAFGSCTSDTDGNLNCTGHINQLVPAAHGQRQLAVYSVGSPQSWFEDFGSGQLADGSASVALEPTFAQTVNVTSDYHVFLTPEGDCRGLYVSNKTASGFQVRELGGGHSNVSFSYRVVALRLGYENVRLEDKTEMMAKLKAETPRPSAAPRPEFKRRTRPD